MSSQLIILYHGLNEELGRHRGKEKKVECGAECESVVYVLWECPAYGSCRLEKLQEISI